MNHFRQRGTQDVPRRAPNRLRELLPQLVLQRHDARALRFRNYVSQLDKHDDYSSFTIIDATRHSEWRGDRAPGDHARQ